MFFFTTSPIQNKFAVMASKKYEDSSDHMTGTGFVTLYNPRKWADKNSKKKKNAPNP
jgi:hypothetical protein